MGRADDETWATYFCEAEELLREFESALLLFEHGSGDASQVNRLYRALHTLKGNSGLLALRNIERLAHSAEDLVALVRDQGVPLGSELMDQLLCLADALQSGLRHVGAHHQDIDDEVANGALSTASRWLASFDVQMQEGSIDASTEDGFELWITPDKPTAETLSGSPESVATQLPGPISERASVRETPAEPGATPPGTDDSGAATSGVPRGPGPQPLDRGGDYLRIHARKVNAIMDLAGELTLASAALILGAAPELREREGFATAAHKLESLIRDLQAEVSAVRLVPIANTFDRIRRVARDASRQTGKVVDLRIIGEETEIDKLMVDGLYEPLVHAVRNAIDHGIETQEERTAAGKAPVGRIVLEASSLGSEVLVRVTDDGRGLNFEKIRDRAVERGLVAPEAELDDRAITDLLFLPGFSTKSEVSNLSGRGVGMDVVRTAVERLRGSVSFETEFGRGSSLVISAPISLAFVETMVVRRGDHLYALPIERVHEVFRVRADQVLGSTSQGEFRLAIREHLVPVLFLSQYHGFNQEEALSPGQIVAVVQNSRGRVAVPIDEVIGTESVMFKGLHPMLSHIRGAAGCGMLRSGEIALALNCDHLAP